VGPPIVLTIGLRGAPSLCLKAFERASKAPRVKKGIDNPIHIVKLKV